MNNRLATITTVRTLKVVGFVIVLSFLIDILILLFPFQPTNRGWQINIATALVDRGIVPMVGLGMLFAGYWIESTDDSGRHSGIDIRFPALILSCFLGLLFLLLFPVHVNNVNQAKTKRVEQINQSAEQLENRLQAQINSEQFKAFIENQKNQAKAISEIIKDEKKYQQIIQDPQRPQAEKELLKKFKANPKELEKIITQQTDLQTIANQELSKIRSQREEAEKQAREEAWRSGTRIGINSLLLSIGYIIIGWTGLKNMGVGKGSARQTIRR